MNGISVTLILIGSFLFTIFYFISLQPEALSRRSSEDRYRFCGVLRGISMGFMGITIVGYLLFALYGSWDVEISREYSRAVLIAGIVEFALTIGLMAIGLAHGGGESSVPDRNTDLHGGIYKFMRHPQTLGEMLCWMGIAMMLNSRILFLYSLIWIPVFVAFTVIEDNDLALRFGDEYIEYTRSTGLFWPKRRQR